MSNEKTNEGLGMEGVGLIVAGYVDEMGADHALDSLKDAKKHGNFDFDDAAVVRRDAKGKVHIKETGDMSTGKGAGIGLLIGGVVGLLGGPAGVAVGAGAGAVVGGLAAHHDAGFDDKSLEEIGDVLPPGTSSIAVTTSKDFVEKVREHAPESERLTAAKELAVEIHDNLASRKDVLMAMELNEDGMAAGKIVSSPEEVDVFGIAASEEGVVAGAGVATPEGAAKAGAADAPAEEKKEEDEKEEDDK
ncbi:DUF1269 domain-containing protein [Methanolobus sp. ZRKC2]|uniref:DUF1269 domain-containing protein n=1 Tax=Methanolobus sp. ZRKC2 TaxID=3125783 RepID=UPI003251FFE5